MSFYGIVAVFTMLLCILALSTLAAETEYMNEIGIAYAELMHTQLYYIFSMRHTS